MVANISFLQLVLLFVILFSTISLISSSVHGNNFFSVDLIHRDSPLSPFYNASEKHSDRVQKAIQRSINRANHFFKKSSTNTITSPLILDHGDLLMKFSLGTPSHEIFALADTGSSLIWTQCKPCVDCYKQIAPIFDPKKSSTYKELSCSSKPCVALSLGSPVSCSGEHKACEYKYTYGAGGTIGNLAAESFIFDSTSGPPVKVPKISFGCGHNNYGILFGEGYWSGIVGLGPEPLSLISQLGSTFDFKFSYCLVNHWDRKSKSKSGKLNFGRHAEIISEGVVSTPLVLTSNYVLTLKGFSVGGKRIAYKNSASKSFDFDDATSTNDEEGADIIIDSGTPVSSLPPEFYKEIETEVKKAIDHEPTDPPIVGLKLCYNLSDDQDIKIPIITAHFTGADIVLQSYNTFFEAVEGVICLGFAPSEKASIFGELSQMNFLIEYDLENKKLSFKPTDCSKHE